MLRVKYPSQSGDLLDSKMFSIISEIRISSRTSTNIVRSLLQAISQGDTPKLKKLTIWKSLYYVDPTLVSRAVLQLQEFVIFGGYSAHLQAILAGIQDTTNTGLRSLSVFSSSHQVSPEVLAGAAVKLERLESSWAYLSSVQLEAILTRSAGAPDSKLRKISYSQIRIKVNF